jgi:hypothetical protein
MHSGDVAEAEIPDCVTVMLQAPVKTRKHRESMLQRISGAIPRQWRVKMSSRSALALQL